jgi:hypothetical protein
MNAALRLVRERLPNVRDQAGHLFESDEMFRELCEEYQMCTEAASRMEGERASAALQKEYAALRLRLEGELLRYLQEHPST